MAGRGSSPPLFELLGRQSPEPAAPPPERPAKPKVKIELKPAPRPEPPEPVERYRRVGTASIAGGMVKLPVSYLYIATAGVALAMILVWATAYKLGGKATEQELADGMTRSLPPASIDPLANPSPRVTAPPIIEKPRARSPEPASKPAPDQPADTPAGAMVLTANGAAPDPREPGLNYLVLESNMEQAEADRVVAFFSGNGQSAIGVPMLDPGGKVTNNPPRYQIVLTRGFPGRGFSDSAPVRAAMVADVRRLGEIWQREYKGSTRFSSPQWTKYTP